MSRARTSLLIGAAALLVAGCTSATASQAPTWVPSPAGPAVEGSPGARLQPILPIPSGPGSSGASGAPGPGQPTPAPSSSAGNADQLVVAKHLTSPVGLTLLPDGSALVGERTTGRIVSVQPRPGQPVPTVRTLTGLDTSGDGGLLDLALSPTYSQDNLIYAYITTPTDNRVVDFTLRGPVTPVLTGIPKGNTDNTGRIAFGGDGDLYIGTGDAGTPALAADPSSLAGKVLRVSDIGRPATGNPTPGSAVFTRGHHVVNGLCPVPESDAVLEVEAGSGATRDEVNLLTPGASYGWPTPTAGARGPLGTLAAPNTAPGGCAVEDTTLYVTSLTGKSLLSAPLTANNGTPALGKFTTALTNVYGRLKTVVAADDGALWLTTSNRDGHGKPVPDDERVIRYVPNAGGGGGSSNTA